ncbi:MAG: BamA/TamA family outer membrane protein, partial [Bacteroidales bacterium]|nr:BamA/TamA family outer membrane protein [Bacteroidales bacterium]
FRLARNEVKIDGDKSLSVKDVDKYIQQKSNSYIIFGWNPFLNLYNLSGRDTSKFSNKIIRKIGEAPVVYESSTVKASVDNINRHMEYLGYYNSKVSSDVSVSGKKVTVTYTVVPGNRYRIGKITYSVPGGEFGDDFMADTLNLSIKSGDYLSEATLEAETERSASWMRRNGWFGFTKNFYSFEADTLSRKDTADLKMIINEYTRNQSAESSKPFRKYSVGDVSISWDKELAFNERILRDMNTIRPGELYNEREVNNTYSRLSALKVFSGVTITLDPRDTADIVDCGIILSPSKTQGFKINLEASTNSNSLISQSPQISYFHKNIFHGGQWLNLSFMGNFQYKYDNRAVRSNESGVSAGLSFPEFLGLPNSLFKGPDIPRTEVNASFMYQDRPEYTRTMISTALGYSGSLSRRRFLYQLYPLQAKIVRLQDMDESFMERFSGNQFFFNAYIDHFDVGSGGMVYYTTCADINPKESYRYVRFQLDASGNVLSLFNGAMKTDRRGSRMIWGIPYSQYVRSELTLGNTVFFGRGDNQSVAFRLLGGYSLAYGNSFSVPLEKQFYSGGASSMRGWQARTLGPGRAEPDEVMIIPSQTVDMKIEANAEYRYPMFLKLLGALFVDVGNTWYSKDWGDDGYVGRDFLKSIAADWGVGGRVDLTFLVLRVDLGVRLYDPSISGIGWYGPREWSRKDCYALHFGVGYPF